MPSKGPHAQPDGNTGANWADGIFLGYSRSSNTYKVATDKGMKYPRSLERVPEPERWSRGVLAGIKCTPENTKVLPTRDEVFEHTAERLEVPTRDEDPLPKQFRINASDLQLHGYTAHCPQCEYIREHQRPRAGGSHSDRCRARIMTELGRSHEGQLRLERHEQKVNEALARRVERADTSGEAQRDRSGQPRDGELGDDGQQGIADAPHEMLRDETQDPEIQREEEDVFGEAPDDEGHRAAASPVEEPGDMLDLI